MSPCVPAAAAAVRPLAFLVLLVASLAGCGDAEDALRRRFAPASPRDRYAEMLRTSGLVSTALGRAWVDAGERALHAPLAVTLPYREVGYFAPDEAAAVAFRVTPRRGQRLSVRVERAGASPATLFVDLFQLGADTTFTPRRVESAAVDSGAGVTLERVVSDDRGALVVRVQPELLRGVRYTITIAAGPSLTTFPVAGKSVAAAQSFFGAGRDGGARRHEGVDIFAPRGTPVVAAGPGVVRDVGTTRLGGKVVWLWMPERGQSLYYAHLDRQIARPGQLVTAGDTLGLVGNTGNAITTSPHLHFGVYRRGVGAVDPLPFIDGRVAAPAPVVADTAALGRWRSLAAGGATVAPGSRALPGETVVRIDAAAGDRYRVRLPDGTVGFVPARRTDRGEQRLALARPGGARPLLERPFPDAVVVDSVPPGSSGGATLLGRWGDYLLVRTGKGRVGWLAAVAATAGDAARAERRPGD